MNVTILKNEIEQISDFTFTYIAAINFTCKAFQ